MPINPPIVTNFSATEMKRAHNAGLASDTFELGLNAELETFLYAEPQVQQAVNSLRTLASALLVKDTLYAAYLGRALGGKKLTTVSLITTVASDPTSSAVCGFATSAGAPNFAAQNITPTTKGVMNIAGTAGLISNTTAFDYTPNAGAHVWAYVLPSTSGTNSCTAWQVGGEIGVGMLQVKLTTTAAAIIVGTPVVMTLPAAAITAQAPFFSVR